MPEIELREEKFEKAATVSFAEPRQIQLLEKSQFFKSFGYSDRDTKSCR